MNCSVEERVTLASLAEADATSGCWCSWVWNGNGSCKPMARWSLCGDCCAPDTASGALEVRFWWPLPCILGLIVSNMDVPSIMARISASSSLCSAGIERRASGPIDPLCALSLSFVVTVLNLGGLVRDADDGEMRL